MAKIVNQASGTFLGLFNMFSGGALEQMSIFALGIMPYISASIILQLLTVVVPKLEQIQKEGEMGRRRINQYTRYGCVILSLIQSFFIARWLESNNRAYAQFGQVVTDPGWGFRLLTMISLTTGTAFIMWLGEQITERGIGNGISLIIFAGIVTDMPDAAVRMFSKAQDRRHHRLRPGGHRRHHRAGRRGHHLLRARAATHPGPVRQAGGRAARSTAGSRRTCRSR